MGDRMDRWAAAARAAHIAAGSPPHWEPLAIMSPEQFARLGLGRPEPTDVHFVHRTSVEDYRRSLRSMPEVVDAPRMAVEIAKSWRAVWENC